MVRCLRPAELLSEPSGDEERFGWNTIDQRRFAERETPSSISINGELFHSERPLVMERTGCPMLRFFARVGKIGPLALGLAILEEENQVATPILSHKGRKEGAPQLILHRGRLGHPARKGGPPAHSLSLNIRPLCIDNEINRAQDIV